MRLIPAQQIYDEACFYLQGKDKAGNPHPKDVDKAETMLNEVLNNNVGNSLILYTIGTLHMEKGHFGLAIQILSQVTQADPKFGEAWNNLALSFRGVNDWNRAAYCAKRAMALIPHPDVPCNVAGMHLNRGTPEKALKYADEALAKDPAHVKSKWHKALALLEMRRWDEAWEWHEARLEGGANEDIATRNYHGPDGMTPTWDGRTPGTVVIHGEQGMGDEIMFFSCLPDAVATGAKIIVEPSPRLEKVIQRSFPTTHVYGTDDLDGRRWIEVLGKPDFKCPVGSLPRFFRRTPESFPGTPYLRPDPGLRAWWGDKLKALGSKPRIGLTWQGGVQSTRTEARSFHPLAFASMLAAIDAAWVSLQYDQTAAENVEEIRQKLGVKIAHWPKAVSARDPETGKQNDLDELIALVSQLDLVVSVCQTAIHVAGALGVPCLCLTPSQPSWRYSAVPGEDMPWYSSVRLIRQAPGTEDWTPVIDQAASRVAEFVRQRKTA